MDIIFIFLLILVIALLLILIGLCVYYWKVRCCLNHQDKSSNEVSKEQTVKPTDVENQKLLDRSSSEKIQYDKSPGPSQRRQVGGSYVNPQQKPASIYDNVPTAVSPSGIQITGNPPPLAHNHVDGHTVILNYRGKIEVRGSPYVLPDDWNPESIVNIEQDNQDTYNQDQNINEPNVTEQDTLHYENEATKDAKPVNKVYKNEKCSQKILNEEDIETPDEDQKQNKAEKIKDKLIDDQTTDDPKPEVKEYTTKEEENQINSRKFSNEINIETPDEDLKQNKTQIEYNFEDPEIKQEPDLQEKEQDKKQTIIDPEIKQEPDLQEKEQDKKQTIIDPEIKQEPDLQEKEQDKKQTIIDPEIKQEPDLQEKEQDKKQTIIDPEIKQEPDLQEKEQDKKQTIIDPEIKQEPDLQEKEQDKKQTIIDPEIKQEPDFQEKEQNKKQTIIDPEIKQEPNFQEKEQNKKQTIIDTLNKQEYLLESQDTIKHIDKEDKREKPRPGSQDTIKTGDESQSDEDNEAEVSPEEQIKRYQADLKGWAKEVEEFDGEKTDPEYYHLEDNFRKAIMVLRSIKSESLNNERTECMSSMKSLRDKLIQKTEVVLETDEDKQAYYEKKIKKVSEKVKKLSEELSETKETDMYYFQESLNKFMEEIDKIDFKGVREIKRVVIREIKALYTEVEKKNEQNKKNVEILEYENKLKKYGEQLNEFDGEKTDPEYYFFEEELRKDIVNLKNIQADQERKKAVMASLQQLRKDLKNKADPPINNEEDQINYLLRKIRFVHKKTNKLRNELENFKQEMTKDDYYYFNESLMRFMADLDKIDSIKYEAIKEDKRAVITSIKSAQELLRNKSKITE